MALSKILLLLLVYFLLNPSQPSQSKHTNLIDAGTFLSPASPGNSWRSPSGLFSFGFYQYGSGFSVGIWLAGGDAPQKDVVVWTFNRDDAPVDSPRATINFTTGGKLLLQDGKGGTKTIAAIPGQAANVSASMLDSGNFVLYDSKSKVRWQSFDHPTDTILGGQRLTVDKKLFSSASAWDQSTGRFYLEMQGDENLVAYPVDWAFPFTAYWTSNTWASNARRDIFLFLDAETGDLSLRYPNATKSNITRISQTTTNRSSVIYRVRLIHDGNFDLYAHSFDVSGKPTVDKKWSLLERPCQNKDYCGLNSYCFINGTLENCSCLPGFHPHSKVTDCYPGFIDEQSCQGKDPEVSYEMNVLENLQWDDGRAYSSIKMSPEDCKQSCLNDCNCWAALFDNGICNKYRLPIMAAVLDPKNSMTAFVKLTSRGNNSLVPTKTKIVHEKKKALVLILASSLGSFAVLCSLLAIISIFLYRRRAHRYQALHGTASQALNGEYSLRSFSYDELEKATDGFKEILGRNHYGAVYKGNLSEGNKSIAVKTLENVEEGESKFRTEMTAVGRTHHRNLVQLLGFCIDRSRKLLVYEFMNNGSLANFLFKVDNRPPWKERVRIALEVARGILYLHEECESRIIHCNIKPQNILLNASWTAKISDFGFAKLLMTNQSGTFTGARGTRAYMAPEWDKGMLITEKADIYSFGVVLLEIISCKNMELNVQTDDKPLQFDWVYDCFLTNDLKKLVGNEEEVDMTVLERMAKVALLCVQYNANLRPAMKSVILMLEGTMNIPEPQYDILST